MTTIQFLERHLSQGSIQIGQILVTEDHGKFELRHYKDAGLDGLETHTDPTAGRTIGLYSPTGEYRFTKGQLDLLQGWAIELVSLEDVALALDCFYPASLGLSLAWQNGRARVQTLRDKLGRQTGMYQYARTISDQGAQHLVQTLCGPSNKCVKKILWDIADGTPLAPSEASDFDGVVHDAIGDKNVPMVCQEACNFFVSECRKAAKKEFEAKAAAEAG